MIIQTWYRNGVVVPRNVFQIKVEPYPIPGSFLKLKYLNTELNVDYSTYAIV